MKPLCDVPLTDFDLSTIISVLFFGAEVLEQENIRPMAIDEPELVAAHD